MSTMTLSGCVEEINDARLFGRKITASRREQLGRFIASRQGLAGSYAGLFAPVDGELSHGYRFLTGERITTRAGTTHILGQESLRALVLLDLKQASTRNAIHRAADSFTPRLAKAEAETGLGVRGRGLYCCLRCSVALWRTLACGAIADADDRLASAMRWLRARRDPSEGWMGIPFYYALSALLEIASDEAREELRYAVPIAVRKLTRLISNDDAITARRKLLLGKVIAMG